MMGLRRKPPEALAPCARTNRLRSAREDGEAKAWVPSDKLDWIGRENYEEAGNAGRQPLAGSQIVSHALLGQQLASRHFHHAQSRQL